MYNSSKCYHQIILIICLRIYKFKCIEIGNGKTLLVSNPLNFSSDIGISLFKKIKLYYRIKKIYWNSKKSKIRMLYYMNDYPTSYLSYPVK